MQLIETKTLGTAAAQIEFTSIPQDGTDLLMLVSARGTSNLGSNGHFYSIAFNGITTGFTQRFLQGAGSGSGSSGSSSSSTGNYISPNDWTANTFGNNSTYIPNYTGSTNKSFSTDSVSENNATDANQIITAGLWSNTAAITGITITVGGGNFAVGSTVSLYKITKGSGGATVS